MLQLERFFEQRRAADRAVEARAGIVEHGLFLGVATDVIVATEAAVRHLSRERRETRQ